ncbi:hypothetical protein A7Q10_02040 [Methylacidiphilum caldifontis]|uniref:Uncharacterized protein n=1 Tax=Methylacidiphilum caldifontis TaxID=2795386 RepID=A0A4Y8P844_9BACT|nr:hypothetical protein A7Q10_02040 [Methylacidiphilum caldifontis]
MVSSINIAFSFSSFLDDRETQYVEPPFSIKVAILFSFSNILSFHIFSQPFYLDKFSSFSEPKHFLDFAHTESPLCLLMGISMRQN